VPSTKMMWRLLSVTERMTSYIGFYPVGTETEHVAPTDRALVAQLSRKWDFLWVRYPTSRSETPKLILQWLQCNTGELQTPARTVLLKKD
jgi:hypothetical protein